MINYLVDCRLFIVIWFLVHFFLTFLYVQKVLCPVNKWVLKQNQSRPTDLECVYDVCSHDACVNPLDNLWCLHLSCHSAKCHMSFFCFSFTMSFFLPFPTHCYPPFSFFSIFLESVLFCFTLSFWPFPVYESLLFLFVFISAFLTLPPPPHFSVFQCLSCLLGLKDHLYPSGYFWQWNVPGFRFLWC